MARYKLNLKYNGTNYFGFQRQENSPTVQLELENALRKICWTGESILSSGRTDRGVHADGHVVTFDHEWSHSLIDLRNAINANLPFDIVVYEVSVVSKDFHPRYDAVSRTYHYNIYFSEIREPFWDTFAWKIWPEIDVSLLNQCAKYFIGTHDFAAIGRPQRNEGSTTRMVFESFWEKRNNFVKFVITGNSFLYHMVRRIVFLQVKFAFGDLLEKELLQVINEQKQLKPGIAPAKGLFLHDVTYFGNL